LVTWLLNAASAEDQAEFLVIRLLRSSRRMACNCAGRQSPFHFSGLAEARRNQSASISDSESESGGRPGPSQMIPTP
jgi:hypothetical protein